jgi:predicted CDP-diglyceride synthetase/phosphatidate cytidylyltransferase
MPRAVTRIVISSSSPSRSLLIAAAIAKLVSRMRGPHEAAADLESAIGGYWPLIIVAIAALTVGFSLAGGGRATPER